MGCGFPPYRDIRSVPPLFGSGLAPPGKSRHTRRVMPVPAPRTRRARVAALALGVALLAGGCPDGETEPTPTEAAGDGPAGDGPDGNDFTAATPQVVSLGPVVTETLVALDRARALVAVSDYCDPPPDRPDVPRAGTALTPSYEIIARAAPSLIVTQAAGGATRQRALERIAPTLALPWRTVEDAAASIRALGAAVDAGPAAEALARRFETTLGDARGEAAPDDDDDEAPAVLGVLASGGDDRLKSIWYVRSDSLHGAAMEAGGLRNALPDPPAGPPELPLEELLRLDPPRILVFAQDPDDGERTVAQLQELTALRAVRGGQVRALTGPKVLHTGPALLGLVPRIRRVWGPEPGR